MNLLPLIERAVQLHLDTCHGVKTERDAEDFFARHSNSGDHVDDLRVVVGPVSLYATCSKGRTQDLPIYEYEGAETVRALGAIAKSTLMQEIRYKTLST